jgi:plasmid replication initiation protein
MAIVKSNKLIETSYKLGSREQFFVLFLISRISQNDTEFREFRISYKDISQIMNFDGRRRVANKEDIFKMMNNLNTQPIRFTEGDEDVQAVWITSLRFNKKTGEFTFTFGQELKPFLLQLKEHFTLFNISNVVYLSGHSIRIYEVLKRHHFKKEPVVLTVNDLKFWLQIENKYPEYYEFKRWVLEPSKEELEKYTDIRFTYREAEKEGKKVISLEFTIFDNEPKENPASLNLLTNLGERLALSAPQELNKVQVEMNATVPAAKKQKLELLTTEQYNSFKFLSEKGINTSFILETILTHPKVRYEPLRGFEDVYFQIMWQFFETKTKSNEKAGAFVNWFKNGRLTEDALHSRFTEGVLEKRKAMKNEEIDRRMTSKTMTFSTFESFLKNQKQDASTQKSDDTMRIYTSSKGTSSVKETVNRILQKKPIMKKGFDFEAFKAEYPEEFDGFLEKATNDYLQFYSDSGIKNTFDIDKNKESIEHRAKSYCEEWLSSIKN